MIWRLTMVALVILTPTARALAGTGQAADSSRLHLADAVERALVQYPTIGLARARTDEAHASIREAFAGWLPTLQLAATAMRYEKPMLVFPLHGLNLQQMPVFDRTLIQAGLTLDYTLFDAGRSARVRRARYQADMSDAALNASQQALAVRVVSSYLSVLAKREILAAHDKRLASLESERSRVNQLRQAGRAADVEVLRVEAALSSAQADRVHLYSALDTSERDLARLVGMTFEEIHAARIITVTPTDSAVVSRDSVISLAQRASPALQQSQQQSEAARAGHDLARGAQWPTLRATGSYVDRGSSEGAYKAEWNAGFVLAYPIFTGGVVRGAIARADAAANAAGEQLRLARIQLAEEVDRALAGVEESRARVKSLEVAADRFAEVVRIEKLSLEAGSRTQTDYLRAEADLLAARAGLVEARNAEVVSRVEMARVTGQLTSGWIAHSLENKE